MEEIEKIQRTPPSKHELERAIAQIKAQYAYTLDGVARQGFVIGIFEMITSFETMARLVEKLEKISPAKVSEIAAKYLTAQNRTIFFFQAEDGIRDLTVTGVQTCALPI